MLVIKDYRSPLSISYTPRLYIYIYINLELQDTMSITLVLQPNSRFFYLNSPLLHHVSKWHENTGPPY